MKPAAKNCLLVVLAAALSSAAIARGQDFIGVPSDVSQDAAFVLEKPAGPADKSATVADATPRTFIAQGADGATAVLNESSLMTALQDARISVESKTAQPSAVLIEEGSFLLEVGGKETIFQLGQVVLSVKNARLSVVKKPKGSVVLLHERQSDGHAKLTVTSPPPPRPTKSPEPVVKKRTGKKAKPQKKTPPSDAAQPAAPPQPIQRHFPLVEGQTVVVKQRSAPVAASPVDQQAIAQISSRLVPHVTEGSLLVLQDIEHPSDLKPESMSAQSVFENIEIEEIEVEAGCVEICLD